MDKFKKHTLVVADKTDTIDNLSIENYLMNRCEPDEIILFLWQSHHTVVIGCHQNPYKECNLQAMEQDGVKLVRRKSGGGAVYHDLGNLNFSFISPLGRADVQRNYQLVIQALKYFGIESTLTGRNDLTVSGSKFSGNAFLEEDGVHCHHGTLLLESSLELLSKYLTPSKLKIESKGIDSVRSRVVNLSSLSEACSVSAVKHQLIETFRSAFDGDFKKETVLPEAYEMYRSHYDQWAWQVGSIPKFNIEFESRFSWGSIMIQLDVQRGIIENCHLSTDALMDEPFQKLGLSFVGKKYQKEVIHKCIHQWIFEERIRTDLAEMIVV